MVIGVSYRISMGVCARGYIPARGIGIGGRYTAADLGVQITVLITGPIDRADAFNRLVFSVWVAKGVMAGMLGNVIGALTGVSRLGLDGRIGLGIDGLALSWSIH